MSASIGGGGAAAIGEPLATSVLQFLAAHPAVTHAKLDERPPVAQREFAQWEKLHSPLVLPADFKAFFALSDGFHLKWAIKMRGEVLPLGNLHINTLSQMKRFKTSKFRLIEADSTGSEDIESDDEDAYHPTGASARSSAAFPQAFDLDAQCPDGHVALIFHSPHKSGVYFQDLGSRWYFVAGTFQAYFRLALMHIGLPRWQYAFTEIGLPHHTKQWFSFLSPQRLAIDLEHGRSSRAHSNQLELIVSTVNKHASTNLNLAKIDELAQSVLSLQQHKSVRINSASKTRTDEEEEE